MLRHEKKQATTMLADVVQECQAREQLLLGQVQALTEAVQQASQELEMAREQVYRAERGEGLGQARTDPAAAGDSKPAVSLSDELKEHADKVGGGLRAGLTPCRLVRWPPRRGPSWPA